MNYNIQIKYFSTIFLVYLIFQTSIFYITDIKGDDIYNALRLGWSRIAGNDFNVVYEIYSGIKGWFFGTGRITHTSIITQIGFFAYFNEVNEVRAGHFIIMLFSCFCFYWFLYISSSRNFSLVVFAIIVTPIFFQVRNFHDPFLFFPNGYMWLVIFFFLSLTFYLLFLEKKNYIYLFLSLLSFFFTAGTFEPGIILFPIFLYLDFLKKGKIKYSILHSLISIFCIVLIIYIRFFHNFFKGGEINLSGDMAYDGANLEIDPLKNIIVYIYQLLSAMPLAYLIRMKEIHLDVYDYIVFSTFGFFIYFYLSKNFNLIFKNLDKKFYIALISIILLSVFPVAISAKYVKELYDVGFGYGYIMVFFQYFAIILIFIFFCSYIKKINIHKNLKVFFYNFVDNDNVNIKLRI